MSSLRSWVYLVVSYVVLCCLVSYCLLSSFLVLSWCHGNLVLSCLVWPFLAFSYLVLSCLALPCHAVALPCLALPCLSLVLFCFVLPCLVFVLFGLASSFLPMFFIVVIELAIRNNGNCKPGVRGWSRCTCWIRQDKREYETKTRPVKTRQDKRESSDFPRLVCLYLSLSVCVSVFDTCGRILSWVLRRMSSNLWQRTVLLACLLATIAHGSNPYPLIRTLTL